MSTQVFDLSQKDGLAFLRENFDNIFWGGDVTDPDSPAGHAFREYALSCMANLDYSTSAETVSFEDLPTELKELLGASYIKIVKEPGVSETYMITDYLGSCSSQFGGQSLSVILPVMSATDSINIVYGGDDKKHLVFASLSMVLKACDLTGHPITSKAYMVFRYESGSLHPTASDLESLVYESGVFNNGVANMLAFKNAGQGGLINVTDNRSLHDAGVENCLWLILPLYSNAGIELQSQVGVSIPVDPENDCSFAEDGVVKYGVMSTFKFVDSGFDIHYYILSIELFDGDYENTYTVSQDCVSAPSCDVGGSNPDCSALYDTYEEAHEAYPDLFPPESPDTGLSATKKHFIRIS